jgi:hypothetical protein
MKPVIIIFIFTCGLLAACYEPYDADIKGDEKILFVDGLVTDEMASYYVRLGYASKFDSARAREPVYSARVTVTDDKGNYYLFKETGNGCYKSDSLKFTGSPGRTYTLNIVTPNGDIYQSDPQKLLPRYAPSNISAEHDFKEIIDQFTGLVRRDYGAKINIDIQGGSEVLPRFRITSELLKQYFYVLWIPLPPAPNSVMYSFYCWQSDQANPDINLTENEKPVSGASINKHEVCFIKDQTSLLGFSYSIGPRQPGMWYLGIPSTEKDSYIIKHRILYLSLYTLNNDSWSYYKGVDKQLSSDGRLFDPIAVQLNGNVECVTRHEKKAFGFFEASSVNRTACIIGNWMSSSNSYTITKVPCIIPAVKNGCWIDKIPPFWIY